jgi:radical SAM superfamily enzyme YgiQ (UPF0313 family)
MHVCCIYTSEFLVPAINFPEKNVYIVNEYIIFPMGILYISSAIKEAGYGTTLNYIKDSSDISLSNIIEQLKEKNTKVIAISSVCEKDYIFIKGIIKSVKQKFPNIKIIIGGQYPTLVPNEVFNNEDVDAICIGEGEIAIVEYIRQVENNNYKKTNNLWIKGNNGEIFKCDESLLIENIDSLPYPDRMGWIEANKIPIEKIISQKILVERGCNNGCIYCSHRVLSKLQKGKYLRFRDIKEIIKEIEFICKEFPNVQHINLSMDNALSNVSYFYDLINSLIVFNKNKKIKFEIMFNVIPKILSTIDGFVQLLKDVNVVKVTCALESGSFEMRKRLNRPYYTNDDIINLCKKLRAADIKIEMFFMYCYPFETEESWNQTIQCLKECKPDMFSLMWLTPFKGTVLYDKVEVIEYDNAPLEDQKRFNKLLSLLK